MANSGWFKCQRCGHEVKILVQDWQTTTSCPKCGGTMRRKDA
ncbi:MAG: hypothetical protein ACI4NU_02590 [Christensenellales bacterium]